ncbi:DUF397 domain-containing protein [Streptomyces violascens]|uniref:DUF397 domain-containing protein n=1 Tax=Streptomyces violascens TaxID=67381 RepID=UPI0036935952
MKSSCSSGKGEACIEIAAPITVHIRDSENPGGPQLVVASGAWAAFTAYATR